MKTVASPTNAQIRANLFAVSPPKCIELSRQSFADGDVVRFNLPKAGIGLFCTIYVKGTFSRTEGTTVGTVTEQPMAPYNLLQNVQLTDFTGITRVNADGYGLYLRQICQRWNAGSLVEEGNLTTPPYSDAAKYRQPYSVNYDQFVIPAGTASSTTTGDINFRLEVPISLHRKTTVGTYPFTVPSGDTYLTVTTSKLSGTGVNYPVNISGTTTVAITSGEMGCTYWYIDPPAGTPMPMADFATIHELFSITQTSGLAAGSPLDFTLDTGRKYYALYGQLVDNTPAPNTVDVEKVRFLINQANPAMDAYLESYLQKVRDDFGRDLPPGAFIWWFADYPWIPASYGSLVAELQLGSSFSAGTSAFLRVLRETTYVTGSSTGA